MDNKEKEELSWQCPTCEVWISMESKVCPSCLTKKPGIPVENGEPEVFMIDNSASSPPEVMAESSSSPSMNFPESVDVSGSRDELNEEEIKGYSIISYKSRSSHSRLFPAEGHQWMFFIGGLSSLLAGIFLYPTYIFASITFLAGLVLRRDGLIKISWILIILAMIITALGMPYGTPWGLILTIRNG